MLPANDIKGKQQLSGVLGRTLIRIKDGTMILKPLFRDYLLKLAEENQIAYQYYISPGGTDGGEIHKENEGIPTAVIEYVRVIFIALMRSLILEIIFCTSLAKRKYYSFNKWTNSTITIWKGILIFMIKLESEQQFEELKRVYSI